MNYFIEIIADLLNVSNFDEGLNSIQRKLIIYRMAFVRGNWTRKRKTLSKTTSYNSELGITSVTCVHQAADGCTDSSRKKLKYQKLPDKHHK